MLRKVPKQSRSEEMVSCILAGATRVLRRTPLASTTTNHIAEVAGVSVGSVAAAASKSLLKRVCGLLAPNNW